MENNLQLTITLLKPAFNASLDAIGVLDVECRLRFANPLMRSLLGLSVREVSKAPVFCDCIKLDACAAGCEISKVIAKSRDLRLDETPAQRGQAKMRVSLKAVPLYYPGKQKGPNPLGAIISARDTSGEILLQAKYHRAMLLLQEKDLEIENLAERLKAKEEVLRRSRR